MFCNKKDIDCKLYCRKLRMTVEFSVDCCKSQTFCDGIEKSRWIFTCSDIFMWWTGYSRWLEEMYSTRVYIYQSTVWIKPTETNIHKQVIKQVYLQWFRSVIRKMHLQNIESFIRKHSRFSILGRILLVCLNLSSAWWQSKLLDTTMTVKILLNIHWRSSFLNFWFRLMLYV